ncbi:NAD(P)-dependent oxidoreductase [Actinomyces sp. B33]|uniref:NAD(P)-dependent oxidoreductase n=1 Tax=Actinomyces sp. B33 TaxID=2942131 RepID=UPI0023419DB0|nr:NAD(P)-dependent oxidoreductase [Actinomyces sp. B33]MDC4233344.1 NAD(P)-dependent oxidoreductase [Actinomyces sp. B33]
MVEKVTFVGIGAIGLPMAVRIAEAGFSVIGVDPFEAQRELASSHGLVAEMDSRSAADADTVVCMVATPAQLVSATLGSKGLLERMRAGSTLIVMSTVGPDAITQLIPAAEQNGVHLLDVPVTGGVAGAKKGSLTLFASGSPEIIEQNAPLLTSMGRILDCGATPGRGQSYKIVNQLLCSVHIVAAAEALAFAEKLGLEPANALAAVEKGAGGSWMLSDRGPRMLEGLDAEVTSAIDIFVKDSTLVSDTADRIGFDAPLVKLAQQKYQQMHDLGHGRKDDSQVIQTYRN